MLHPLDDERGDVMLYLTSLRIGMLAVAGRSMMAAWQRRVLACSCNPSNRTDSQCESCKVSVVQQRTSAVSDQSSRTEKSRFRKGLHVFAS